jgi:hypothetical protein
LRRQYLTKKLKILIADNKIPLLILFSWFALGFLVYFFGLHLSGREAFKACFFFKNPDDRFSSAYNTWSQGIIFGVLFSLLTQNIMEKYNPERGCRMMAKEMHNHIIVIGYSHLGERLVSFLREKKIPYCLIEKDKEKTDELLRLGEPVVTDDARERDALDDANVREAKAVILASNNLETALLVTKRVREINRACMIITRCYRDDLAEIIETLGANDVISSSKNAFEDILKKLSSLSLSG